MPSLLSTLAVNRAQMLVRGFRQHDWVAKHYGHKSYGVKSVRSASTRKSKTSALAITSWAVEPYGTTYRIPSPITTFEDRLCAGMTSGIFCDWNLLGTRASSIKPDLRRFHHARPAHPFAFQQGAETIRRPAGGDHALACEHLAQFGMFQQRVAHRCCCADLEGIVRWRARELHSIRRSARTNPACEIVTPNACAVVRLTIHSILVARSTGRSAGLAPLRILSTNTAARRNRSGAS